MQTKHTCSSLLEELRIQWCHRGGTEAVGIEKRDAQVTQGGQRQLLGGGDGLGGQEASSVYLDLFVVEFCSYTYVILWL